jgi:hypothetical protein
MLSPVTLHTLFACFLLFSIIPHGLSQSSSVPSSTRAGRGSSSATSLPPPASSSPPLASSSPPLASSSIPIQPSSAPPPAPSSSSSATGPPDVFLNVPKLSVGRIELVVDNLKADINLNANVASLVSINAGVALSIQKVNLTIVDVNAELQLIVRLSNLVQIVNRVFQSLDLNPLLISTLNNVTGLLKPIVGAVDGLLGSITQGGTVLSFLVDNLGNVVQQVTGANGGPVNTIVGDFLTNMTDTGVSKTLQNGLVQKTYSYSPLNALVDIVFNAAGQVVQATVVKQTGGTGTSSSVSVAGSTALPSSSRSA